MAKLVSRLRVELQTLKSGENATTPFPATIHLDSICPFGAHMTQDQMASTLHENPEQGDGGVGSIYGEI